MRNNIHYTKNILDETDELYTIEEIKLPFLDDEEINHEEADNDR